MFNIQLMPVFTKKILLYFVLSLTFSAQAQFDTLRVMYYNLLDYPNSDPGRESNFRTINQYAGADVICVTELKSATGASLFLNQALNVFGTTYYDMASYISGDFSENLIYFNQNKLGLVSQDIIYTDLRDINEYVLYYKSVDLATTHDTVYLYFYIAHLKANQGYEQDRLNEVNDFLAHLNALPDPQNVFFGGDFNFYTSAEPAYQAIVNNAPVPLNDPLQAGNWHNSSIYSLIHTQSTRLADFGGGSTGGMDDRFDFITFTDDVLNGSNKVKYISNSCIALGNDGDHFNLELIDPPANPTVPDSVIQALYYGSDHLPVICDLRIEAISPLADSKMVITEIMYNPPEFGMDTLEFIELYNAGTEIENLEGFYFSQGVGFTFPEVYVSPGQFIVLANQSQAMLNTFGISALQWTSDGLNNSGELILLSDPFGRTVDSVNYSDAAPWPLAPDGNGPSLTLCNPALNNSDPLNWASSTNFITNNASNDPIYASPGFNECGLPPIADFTANLLTVETGGAVSFTDLSLNSPTAWNWTFTGGNPAVSVSQNPVVTYNTPGSFMVSLSVSNVHGSNTEIRNDYILVIDNNGLIIISEVMNNPFEVSDANGEWFEVFNAGNTPVDMNGWTIRDDGSDLHTISASVVVPAKGFAVFGINQNTAENGGYVCDYQYSGLFLSNSDDELELIRPDNSQSDKIVWDGGPTWPDLNGVSMVFTGTASDDNNNPAFWTASTMREDTYPVAGQDLGSPGTNGALQNLVAAGLTLDLKVFMQGPYLTGLMSTHLIMLPDFPLAQPYHTSPWFYMGTESVAAIPSPQVVDWVLIELRDALSPSTAYSTTSLQSKAAFVLNNGKVVDTDGYSDLFFEVSVANQLFVVVHHRNHLSVMSSVPVVQTGAVYAFDFSSSASQAYNNGQTYLGDNNYGMISGDSNGDGTINENDKTDHWQSNAGNSSYSRFDLNFDRQVNNPDKNELWYPNRGLGSQVPD